MNAPRKKQVVALPDSHEMSRWSRTISKYLNTALTIFLLIAAGVLFYRWRVKSAELARQSVGNEVAHARSLVMQLGPAYVLSIGPQLRPTDLVKTIESDKNEANTAISNVLNTSDDAKLRAEALMLRGDLYWNLANLPPLPGAATQPALHLSESSDALLQKSWDAYQEVLKNSTYAFQHEELAGSHLGLAAIAENRADWATAKSELEAVANDSSALVEIADQAKLQLTMLPEIQKKLYVAPQTGIAPVAVSPPTPIGPPAPVPTTQFSLPSAFKPVLPTTLPFKP